MTSIAKTVLALALVAAGALLWAFISRWYTRLRFRHRMKRGARGEERARVALERRGFTIIEEQPELMATMWLDGDEKRYTVRVDYLVARDGARGIVEVKTGKKATDPLYAPTRRQIFEYAHLYDVEKIWFMNGDTLELTEICFEPGTGAMMTGRRLWWLWFMRALLALTFMAGVLYLFSRIQ